MMGDMSKDAVKLYRPAVHTDGAACMVDCKIGFWVSKPDYDALAVKLADAERRERQLLDTIATCRMLRRELNTAKAKLAEVEAEVWEQRDLRNHQCKLKLEAMARAEAAEAALPAVYRLAAKNHAKWLRKQAGEKGGTKTPQGRTAQFYARKLGEQPTPTAAELMARINEGEPQ